MNTVQTPERHFCYKNANEIKIKLNDVTNKVKKNEK